MEMKSASNEMEQWAAYCKKELKDAEKWFENWSDVYFPGQEITGVDGRKKMLLEKKAKIEAEIEKVKEERSKISIESFESPYKVRTSDLKAAYPFG